MKRCRRIRHSDDSPSPFIYAHSPVTPTKPALISSSKLPRPRVLPFDRHKLLVKWLSPKVEGDEEAGRFFQRPAREITPAFNQRFGTDVSERTVLRYLHEALAWAKRQAVTDKQLALQADQAAGEVTEFAATLLTRGRPKSGRPPIPRGPRKKRLRVSEQPKLIARPRVRKVVARDERLRTSGEGETAALEAAVPERSAPDTPRTKPGPKPQFKRWSRIWWEIQALTGWSAYSDPS